MAMKVQGGRMVPASSANKVPLMATKVTAAINAISDLMKTGNNEGMLAGVDQSKLQEAITSIRRIMDRIEYRAKANP
jgi:hypothetical protein